MKNSEMKLVDLAINKDVYASFEKAMDAAIRRRDFETAEALGRVCRSMWRSLYAEMCAIGAAWTAEIESAEELDRATGYNFDRLENRLMAEGRR